MADAFTKKYNLIKPEVGSSRDAWGGKWNSNADVIDTALDTANAGTQKGKSGGYFKYLNNGECTFFPSEGNSVFINGKFYVIPTAGVSFKNVGLTASTLYYAYIFMKPADSADDPPVMTGEWAATAPALDPTYGHMVKNGDASRILVGMSYPDAGNPGLFSANNVMSHLNRRDRVFQTVEVYQANGSGVEAEMANFNTKFMAWPDSAVEAFASGRLNNSTPGTTNYFYVRLSIPGLGTGAYSLVQGGELIWGTLASRWAGFAANAGQFVAKLFGYVNNGQGNCYAQVTVKTQG